MKQISRTQYYPFPFFEIIQIEINLRNYPLTLKEEQNLVMLILVCSSIDIFFAINHKRSMKTGVKCGFPLAVMMDPHVRHLCGLVVLLSLPLHPDRARIEFPWSSAFHSTSNISLSDTSIPSNVISPPVAFSRLHPILSSTDTVLCPTPWFTHPLSRLSASVPLPNHPHPRC